MCVLVNMRTGALGGARRFGGLGQAHADQPPSKRATAGSALGSRWPPLAGEDRAACCTFLSS